MPENIDEPTDLTTEGEPERIIHDFKLLDIIADSVDEYGFEDKTSRAINRLTLALLLIDRRRMDVRALVHAAHEATEAVVEAVAALPDEEEPWDLDEEATP